MVDTIKIHDMLSDKFLFYLRNNMVMGRNTFRGYEGEYHAQGAFQKGDTLRIKLPNKARTVAGPDITSALVDTRESNSSIVVDQHRVAAFDFTAQQLTQDITQLAKKYIRPEAIAISNFVDKDLASLYKKIYNFTGTPGTTPSNFSDMVDPGVRLDEEAAPSEDRVAVFSSKTMGSMADGELKTLFNQPIVGEMLRKGFRGQYYEFDVFKDQNIQAHTVGTHTGSITMNATPSEEATQIVLAGMGGGTTLTEGDIITIAATVGVNPISGDPWEGDTLRQFVVTALATENGTTTVNVSPEIISSAAGTKLLPYQTVVTLPQSGAVVTVVTGAASEVHPQHLFFHKDAMALAIVPFVNPDAGEGGNTVNWSVSTDPDTGFSITLASQFNILLYKHIYRADILYGIKMVRPELAVRLTG